MDRAGGKAICTWYTMIGLTVLKDLWEAQQRLFRVEGPGFLGWKYVGGTDIGLIPFWVPLAEKAYLQACMIEIVTTLRATIGEHSIDLSV